MIVHKYTNASDNRAQYEADCIGRQEVTVDWYLEHMIDEPVFRWVSDEDHLMGLDPWRFYMDLPIDPEEVKERGWRLFVQRSQMPGGGSVGCGADWMSDEEKADQAWLSRTA